MGRTLETQVDVACPRCAHKLRVAARQLGKKARGAKGEDVFRLPTREAGEAAATEKPTKKAKPRPETPAKAERAKSPETRARSPEPRARSPEPRANSPD